MSEPARPRVDQLRPSRQRLFRLIALAFTAVFLALVCLGAEFAARYHERHRSTPPDYFPSVYYPHRRLRYGLVPNVDYYGWFKINSLGFRGGEVSADKKPGVLRVVCLGGSTTFDIGSVGAARPWPEVLQAELRKRLGTQSLEVLNLGIGGATSLDSLIDLQMRAIPFNPDLVIVFQGHNDLSYSIPPSQPERSTLFPMEDRPRSSLVRWLTYHSLLYAKTEERVTARVNSVFALLGRSVTSGAALEESVQDRDRAMERGFSDFRSNLRSIAAIARANHIPLALVEVAVPFPSEGQAKDECKVCEALPATYGGVDLLKLRAMFGRYNDVLVQLGGEGNGVYYIPTDDFVPNADRYYSDPVHFGPEGSLRMGTRLGEALAPVLPRTRVNP